MPTYGYECSACGNAWDEFQLITEKPKRRCPKCRKLTARRLIGGGAAILFKGAGFYQTDYRSADYKKQAKAESQAASGTSGDKDKSKTSSPKSED